ncbi:MAG: HAMP domain-containing histidine kinase [Leadbetterella sp.]|nr:HAMP domain-containing histidine kinase [Leadbetterella sp.]
MKKSQNTTALILMVASVLLLATSQYFWLKSEYKEHKRAFYSNADLLFKETVRGIEDSLVSRVMTHNFFVYSDEKQDSSRKSGGEKPKPGSERREFSRRSPGKEPEASGKKRSVQQGKPQGEIRFIGRSTVKTDTLIRVEGIPLGRRLSDSSDTIILDSGVINLILRAQRQEDSLKRLKRVIAQIPRITIQTEFSPGAEREERPHTPRRRLVFLSAPLDSVEKKFNHRIREMGYTVAFSIQKDSIPPDTSVQGFRRSLRYSQTQKRLRSARDSVVVNGVAVLNPESISSLSIIPTVIFKAYPEDLKGYLLGKLRNNVLFSAFLLLVTSLTFGLIFRNLRKQSRLNTLKNDLISNVTHELKTPLATLSVALEALQQFGGNANPQTTREYLEISQNEVNRLSLMVDNILKTSLLEKQGVTIYPSAVDLEGLSAMAVKSWQPRFSQAGGSIRLNAQGTDFTIEADEVQVSSVINNLIDNALKYATAGPEVAIEIRTEPHFVTLSIKDNGIGIPREYQGQVFEKFFRVPTGDRHNVKGYGLGLNYVKHIMDLHQGLVTLESGSNGTTFMLTFKRKL